MEKIIREYEADVQFMRKSSLTNNTYTWPSKADIDTVAGIFVFDFDFQSPQQMDAYGPSQVVTLFKRNTSCTSKHIHELLKVTESN